MVQGGGDKALRARCAQALAEIGFDGYGFGGYPVVDGRLVDEVALVAELVPPGSVLHGLGIGTPDSLVSAWRARLRDLRLHAADPQRAARRGLHRAGHRAPGERGFCRVARLDDERWVRRRAPVDPDCDCQMCALPAGYVAHLFRLDESLAGTLASLHNLRFYTRLTQALRPVNRIDPELPAQSPQSPR